MKLTLYKDGHNKIPNSNGYEIGEQKQESAWSYIEDDYTEEEWEDIADREPIEPLIELIRRWHEDDAPLGDLTVRAFRIDYGKKNQRSTYHQISNGIGDYRSYADVEGVVRFLHSNEKRIEDAIARIQEEADNAIHDIEENAGRGDKKRLEKAMRARMTSEY